MQEKPTAPSNSILWNLTYNFESFSGEGSRTITYGTWGAACSALRKVLDLRKSRLKIHGKPQIRAEREASVGALTKLQQEEEYRKIISPKGINYTFEVLCCAGCKVRTMCVTIDTHHRGVILCSTCLDTLHHECRRAKENQP